MEKKTRRDFIKTTGSALLVTTGISVFGVFTGTAKPNVEGEESADSYYADGYYSDGYSTGILSTTRSSISLSAFPNPSDGNFNLVLNAEEPVQSNIFIQDISGKTLVTRSYSLWQGANHITFESLDLPRGIYVLSVVTAKSADSIKIIIAG